MIPRINIDKVILVSETFSIFTPKKKKKKELKLFYFCMFMCHYVNSYL